MDPSSFCIYSFFTLEIGPQICFKLLIGTADFHHHALQLSLEHPWESVVVQSRKEKLEKPTLH